MCEAAATPPPGPPACVGDCNGDGVASAGELTKIITIIASCLGTADGCPAMPGADKQCRNADRNGNGIITAGELTFVIANIINYPGGCPPPAHTATPTVPPTRTPTRTPTPPPTSTRTQRPTDTAPLAPSATSTPTVAVTATPGGVLFSGPLAGIVPHAAGDTLVYHIQGPGTESVTETTLVTSVTGDKFVVDITRGPLHHAETYIDAGTEIRYVSIVEFNRSVRTSCSPPLLRLISPLVAGVQHSTTTTCDIRLMTGDIFVGSFSQTDTFTGIEIVDSLTVPAGTYSPVIRIAGTRTLGEETNDVWLTPGVGVLRRVAVSNKGTQITELLDGTVGGQSVRR